MTAGFPVHLAHGAGSGFEFWMVGALAGVVIAVGYLAISFHVFRGVYRANGWLQNPLAVATGAIFFSCGVGHGIHASHVLLPFFGVDVGLGMAAREVFNDWHLWVWDSTTAAVAVWYWSLRGRFRALTRGPTLFEDLRRRQQEALEIHDNVVQGLTQAKLALDLGRTEDATEELEQTMAASRRIITRILGPVDSAEPLRPGDLRRKLPGGGAG